MVKGRFAVMDMADYDKMTATIDLMSKLSKGEDSAKKGGWISFDDAVKNAKSNYVKILFLKEQKRPLSKSGLYL